MNAEKDFRSNLKILLISCYELGRQPLGLASPVAFLERAGYRAEAIDVSIEPLDERRVRQADFVGISVPMHTALRLGARVADRVRALNPTCHLCFYGLYASLHADYLLGRGADSVVGGEYEQALVELVDRIARSPARPDRRPRIFLDRLSFPVPQRRELAPLDSYAALEHLGELRRVGTVEASRGCLHQCLHCPIPPVYGGRFFVVPREIVLEDIRRLVSAGATHITFADPDFLNGPGHVLPIVRRMHAEHPELTFDFTSKVEHLLKHRASLPELARLGGLFIVSAVESLSDRVLQQLRKGHRREDVFLVLRWVREAGICLRPTWVPFTPWTRLADYLSILDWVAEEDLIDHVDPVQFSIRLLVPPGSLLLNRPGMKPHLGRLDQDSLTYEWRHPDPRMDSLQSSVSDLVERQTAAGLPAPEIFESIRELAFSTAGRRAGRLSARPRQAPRLTETWFC